MTDYSITETTERSYFYVERTTTCEPDAIGQAMGEAYQVVWNHMTASDVAPAGAALSVYYTYEPDSLSFRAGFFIDAADMAKASGEVRADVTPATRALTFVHTGPYSGLRGAYSEAMAYMEAEGLQMRAPTWEVYLNDPASTPEADLQTEIFMALG